MSGNRCIGVDVNFSVFRNDMGVCWIKKSKACTFFARCILPLAVREGYKDTIDSYRVIDSSIKNVKTRHCKCGSRLARRARYCEKCRKKKKLESKRRYWHKQKV